MYSTISLFIKPPYMYSTVSMCIQLFLYVFNHLYVYLTISMFIQLSVYVTNYLYVYSIVSMLCANNKIFTNLKKKMKEECDPRLPLSPWDPML